MTPRVPHPGRHVRRLAAKAIAVPLGVAETPRSELQETHFSVDEPMMSTRQHSTTANLEMHGRAFGQRHLG